MKRETKSFDLNSSHLTLKELIVHNFYFKIGIDFEKRQSQKTVLLVLFQVINSFRNFNLEIFCINYFGVKLWI